MRLMELGDNVPKQAGLAKLKYSSDTQIPERHGKTIVIPADPSVEIFPLQEEYNQFLLNCDGGDRLWFGGTDENPFLVRIDGGLLTAFLRKGIAGFYTLLVPDLMTRLKGTFGGDFTRQGDIFSYPIPHSWEELKSAKVICCGKGFVPGVTGSKGISVFGTRHVLYGNYFERLSLFGNTMPLVVEGRISAPDHKDIELVGRPFILAQTNGLYSPQSAD